MTLWLQTFGRGGRGADTLTDRVARECFRDSVCVCVSSVSMYLFAGGA